MYHSPNTTSDKVLEIVTPEWQYFDNDDFNFNETRVVPVKEQRRMGTQRGNKTTPQAPAIEVRAKGLPDIPIACRCRLWNFGSCLDKEPPKHDGTAMQLTMLRTNVQIEVTENVAIFGPTQEDGYRHARLRCFITRGARVQCRKFHIAFYIDCVYLPPGMAIPGPDDSSFAIGDLVEMFPWVRSARMSISEKAMCPRLHDKTKKARVKMAKGSGSSDSDHTGKESSPKRMKKGSADTPASSMSQRSANSGASATKKTPSPMTNKVNKSLGSGGGLLQGAGLLMHPQMGMGNSVGQNALYPAYLDRQLRMSRLSFPGLEEEIFNHPSVPDEGDLVNMESTLGQGRRSSQFVGSQYWPPMYLNQHNNVNPHQNQQQQNSAAGSNGNGSNNGGSNNSSMGVSGQNSFNGLQSSFPMDQFNGVELSQRRLSAGGHWAPDLQQRRISSADIGRITSSPLPASHQPGRGPEWDALFDAHSKVLNLDKSSPDYLTKKNVAMAEVYRAAELIEQRLRK